MRVFRIDSSRSAPCAGRAAIIEPNQARASCRCRPSSSASGVSAERTLAPRAFRPVVGPNLNLNLGRDRAFVRPTAWLACGRLPGYGERLD